jgi:transposase-like protein
MARPPVFPAEEKVRIVLSILAGEVTVAEAARRAKVSEQSVGKVRRPARSEALRSMIPAPVRRHVCRCSSASRSSSIPVSARIAGIAFDGSASRRRAIPAGSVRWGPRDRLEAESSRGPSSPRLDRSLAGPRSYGNETSSR